MIAIMSLQPSLPMKASSTTTLCSEEGVPFSAVSVTQQTQPQPRIPSPEYIVTRLHCISSYKLRLEASQQEPRLRKLLGHIQIYDTVREHQQLQYQPSSPTASRRREQQLRRRQMSEHGQLSPLNSTSETEEPPSDNESEIKAYLSTVELAPRVRNFADFQRAIQQQIATLSQIRVEAASRELYNMTREEEDDFAVADEDDYDSLSDYDSYDGEDPDWRHYEDEVEAEHDGEDSDTDHESVPSEPPSPTEEHPPTMTLPSLHGHEDKAVEKKGVIAYFGLRPMVPRLVDVGGESVIF